MSESPIYGLVCAGGGADGAYQVGALKYIFEHFCDGDRSPFHVYCGTSCGNLCTSFFASRSYDARQSRLELEQLWLEFDVPSYSGSKLKNAASSFLKRRKSDEVWSLLDPQPLVDVTKRGFDRASLDQAFERGTTLGVSVSATELRSGRLCFFIEGPNARDWSVFHSNGVTTRLEPAHVQASCTVPIAFPPVRIGSHYFVDGGLGNRRPLAPAGNMGATRILSIATDRPHPHALPEYPAGYKPGLGDLFASLLDQLTHDYAADQAYLVELVSALKARAGDQGGDSTSPMPFLGDGEVRPDAFPQVEVLSLAPSRRIRYTEIYDHDLFDPKVPSKDTLLMFEREFNEQLIGFGYEDAHGRHAELALFFDRDRAQEPSRFWQHTRVQSAVGS